MKIGFVVDDTLDKPDGVQQYVFTLSKWLIAQGHEVHFLVGETHRTDMANVHSLSKNISVRFNKNRLSIPLPAKKQKIKELLAREKFDVLHVQMPHNPFLAARVVHLAHESTAVVGTFHIAPFSRLETSATKLLGKWLKRNLRNFDDIVSVSEAAQDFAKKTFHLNTQVLPNVIDINDFHVGAIQHVRPTITFLGRLVPRKGCSYLLGAISVMEQKYPGLSYKLRICGDGPEQKRLWSLYKELPLHGKVRFTGQVTEAQKKAYLATSDIAVFPSTGGESFGIVLLEAMAAGSGVVLAGDNPGYHSVMGSIPECLINPTDTDMFAEKLHEMLTDKALVETIHKRQQKLVQQYDIGVVGPALLSIYKNALSKKR